MHVKLCKKHAFVHFYSEFCVLHGLFFAVAFSRVFKIEGMKKEWQEWLA